METDSEVSTVILTVHNQVPGQAEYEVTSTWVAIKIHGSQNVRALELILWDGGINQSIFDKCEGDLRRSPRGLISITSMATVEREGYSIWQASNSEPTHS